MPNQVVDHYRGPVIADVRQIFGASSMPRNLKAKLRFNVWDLLKFQFLLSPMFLAVPYADYQSSAGVSNPFQSLAWFVLPPMLYVLLFVTFKLRRTASRSYVFTGVRYGTMYGLLFGGLAWGPIGCPAIAGAISEFCKLLGLAHRRGLPITFPLVTEIAKETFTYVGIVAAFCMVHYAVIGAALGAVAGLMVDWTSNMPLRCHTPIAEHADKPEQGLS